MIDLMIALVLGFLFSALFSGAETGSYMVNRIRLRRRVRDRSHSALALARLLEFPYIFIYTMLIGNNITNFLVTKVVTDAYMESGMDGKQLLLGFIPWTVEMAATLTLVFPMFLLAELLPKNVFRKKADVLMYRLAYFLRLLVLLMLPATWLLKQLFKFLTHGADSAAGRDLHRLSPDALREYFSTGERDGVITSHQNRMLDNVTSMHRTPIRDLMTPLKDIPRLPEEATVADFKRLIGRGNASEAIMVHRHAVVGLVSMFPVIARRLDDAQPLRPYAEDVLRLPENGNLKSAFYRLRRNPRHCAVVVDARQHPVGLVRLEDIARYIARK